MSMRCVFTLMGLLYCLICSGQQEKTNERTLSIVAGYKLGMLVDENFSPLHYQDRGAFYGLTFQRYRPTKQRSFYTEALYNRTGIHRDSRARQSSEYLQGHLSIGVLQKFEKAENAAVRWWLGGGYQFGIHFLEWYEDERGDQDAFSFLAAHSLLLRGRYERVVKEEHLLSIEFSAPAVSLLVRPPYNGTDREFEYNVDNNTFGLLTNGEWVSPFGFTEFNTRLGYQLPLNDRWGISGTYQLTWRNANEGKQWAQFQNFFLFSLNRTW